MDHPDILKSTVLQQERVDLLYDMAVSVAGALSAMTAGDTADPPVFTVSRADMAQLVGAYLERLAAYKSLMRMQDNRISLPKVAALTCLLVMERAPIRTSAGMGADIAPAYHSNSNLCMVIAVNMLDIDLGAVPLAVRRDLLYFFVSLSKVQDHSDGGFPFMRRFRFAALLLTVLEKACTDQQGR